MENIIISNPEKFNILKEHFIEGRFENLHIVSDFDRTLTYSSSSTSFSALRDGKVISQKYEYERDNLFKYYHPYEISLDISNSEKQKLLDEWWRKHLDLFSEYKISKTDIAKLASLRLFKFRNYLNNIINLSNNNKVPFFIFSAGVGDIIKESLAYEKMNFDKVFVESNFLKFNLDGVCYSHFEPVIHTFNKSEKSIKNNSVFEEIKNRKNVILLGDSLGDVQMIDGFEYNNLLKVGFLNFDVEKNLEEYKKNYDVVIINDSSLEFVYNLLKEFQDTSK